MNPPRIVAGFGFRYDKDLVNDCIANLESWVDDFAILDDTKHNNLWRNEHEYRVKIRQLALDKKADYLLITSPDERWERNAGNIIRTALINESLARKNEVLTPKQIYLATGYRMLPPPKKFTFPTPQFVHRKKFIYTFDLKELWTPLTYRTDGIWGRKKRPRLFKLEPGQVFDKSPIQCKSYPINSGYQFYHLPVNIYHLKMINPQNRKLRAEVFKKLDPDLKYQGMGYDYLYDESNLTTERIPPGRGYSPRYSGYTFTVPKEYL